MYIYCSITMYSEWGHHFHLFLYCSFFNGCMHMRGNKVHVLNQHNIDVSYWSLISSLKDLKNEHTRSIALSLIFSSYSQSTYTRGMYTVTGLIMIISVFYLVSTFNKTQHQCHILPAGNST